jgi:hypothetical protein
LYDRSLAGSVANSELSGKQEFDNFKTALNSPIQNFSEYYPMISELLGAFGNASRSINNLPQDLNRALSRR